MKRLILMRHAKSDWSGGGTSDHDRVLNARGRDNAAALGRWLKEKGLFPDVVLCSSAARTRETLNLLGLSGDPDTSLTRKLYLADAELLLAGLREVDGDTVLIIGHNPGIGEMAEMIIDTPPNPDGIRHYPTGATLAATFDIERWKDVKWHTGHVTHIVMPRDLPVPQ